ncbi:hypothetical protein EV189_1662 [Motilibacter rhizosphaerae]|uniref:Uncharacterized protein n=1 Tax=Motilibacter rhizosphaerae TaxID=598652 RepID=A0A4Q7NS96_9ACTN|nr:hypothetical protein [Motilibacter rhizosphaerae]RZS89885.1 hypothetical protein EV189_1662 [Motilibacter rhizosphaerae]
MATTPAPTGATDASMSALAAAISQAMQGGAGQQGAIPGLGVSKSEQGTYKVFLGHGGATSGSTYSEQVPGAAGPNRQPIISDYDSAMADIYKWTPDKLKSWEQHLLTAGLIKPGQYDFSDLVSAWQNSVDQAAKFHTLGGKNVTPEQVVDMNAGLLGTKPSGPTTQTQTASSVNEVDPGSARDALDNAFRQLLGRDPSNNEREQFATRMLKASKANPSVTTSKRTTTTGKDGLSSTTTSSTDTKGGFTANDVLRAAQDTAKSLPEYGAHEAATTAYNWLQQAIASP